MHLDGREAGEVQDDDGRVRPGPLRGDVGPRHVAYPGEIQGRPGLNLRGALLPPAAAPRRRGRGRTRRGELLLQAARLGRREVEIVQLAYFHAPRLPATPRSVTR